MGAVGDFVQVAHGYIADFTFRDVVQALGYELFSGFAGSIPTFSISGEVPRSVRLFLSGGRLYVCRVSGTTIVIR